MRVKGLNMTSVTAGLNQKTSTKPSIKEGSTTNNMNAEEIPVTKVGDP